MKTLINITLITSALLLSSNTTAAKPLSEGQALAQCKALANSQFDNVKRVKVAHMKSTRGLFKAKLRVKAENDKGMFLCTISNERAAQIVRLDKDSNTIASK